LSTFQFNGQLGILLIYKYKCNTIYNHATNYYLTIDLIIFSKLKQSND
jgi:hypothetical protein